MHVSAHEHSRNASTAPQRSLPQLLEISFKEVSVERDEDGDEICLGAGSFKKVLKARWNGATVAVARPVQGSVKPEVRQALLRELHIAASLRHPNVVQVWGAATVGNKFQLVMEYAERRSLFHVLHEDQTALEVHQRCQIMEGTVAGVSYLHSRKVGHRDLKSLNILITKHLEAKITDVGEAVVKDQSMPTSLNYSKRGTPLYMAPEVMVGRPYNVFPADIYSLALVLYEIMSSQLPFVGQYRDRDKQRELVVSGMRPCLEPLQPPCVFHQMIPVLEQAWQPDAAQRPRATEFTDQIRTHRPL